MQKKAFELSELNTEGAEILDIGCGSGMQTIALAKLCTECIINAVDIHQPFLDDLKTSEQRRTISSHG
ncbi:class I SAM-dependent methyltransferase [Methanogenium marinum]|uniref:Class I SAM-dependent methyltransferase n=1 Tax=Methanogenium marinum TaxID=348610 RepID=A0A9Q4KS57_9EURY|nr:class I SAM-dependent methyltransferase [Methanogenium marinum]MDE4907624.1 class I SAM-dependent methyltransferase [Methanogenium marinum]